MVKIRFFVRIFALMGLYNLLLPLKLDWLPVYSCDSELRIGQRVEVNFLSLIHISEPTRPY